MKLLLAAILLFLLMASLIVVPAVLVNRPEIRAALQRHVGAALGGEAAFDQIDLTLIPRVCASFGNLRVFQGGVPRLRARELEVCLKLLPLLRGRVVPAALRAQSPEFNLPVEPLAAPGPETRIPDPRLILLKAAESLKRLPVMAVEVTDGRLALARSDGMTLDLREMNMKLRHVSDRLECSLRGRAGFAETFSAEATLSADSFEGVVRLALREFNPQVPYHFFLPHVRFQVQETQADLDLTLNLRGPERLNAIVQAKAPVLTLSQDGRATRMRIDGLTSELELTRTRLAVMVSEFESRSPQASLEVTFIVDEDMHPRIDINIQGRGEVAGARDFSLALLHGFKEVQLVCDILRSGEVPGISVALQGDTWKDLTHLNNLLIRGRLEKGRIHIPHVEIDPEEVYGDVLISGGILEGADLKAHYLGTRGENGTLRLGLSRANPVLDLDIFLRADLGYLPPILERVVPSEPFQRELKKLRAVSGAARGTLGLTGTLQQVAVRIEASDLDVQARHQSLPDPVHITCERFFYGNRQLALQAADISTGNSKLSGLNLKLDQDLYLEAQAPQATLDLTEAFNLASGLPRLKGYRTLQGLAVFKDSHVSGKIFEPETWQFRSGGTVKDVYLETEVLPLPLRISSGSFQADRSALRLRSWEVRLGSSAITGLGCDLDWAGSRELRMQATGITAVVEELHALLKSNAAGIGAVLEPFAPLAGTIRTDAVQYRTSFDRRRTARMEFSAALKNAAITSPRFEGPLTTESGSLRYQNGRVEIKAINAALGRSSVRGLELSADADPAGEVALAVASAVIRCEDLFPALTALPALKPIREDIAHIQGTLGVSELSLGRRPGGSGGWRMRAAAELGGIIITTTFLDELLEIPAGRLATAGSETSGSTALRIEATHLRLGPDGAVLTGQVAFTGTETALDLDIASDSLDGDRIAKIADQIADRRKPGHRPLRGRIRLRAERLIFERFQLDPFYVDATLSPEGTQILIERTSVCGMLFIGRMAFEGPVVDAYLVPVVDVRQLDRVVSCLTEERSIVTGTFNLDGELRFKARLSDIRKALSGHLAFVAENGVIQRSLFFARLFALLNLTEIYRGQLPDFDSRGLTYERSAAVVEPRGGKLLVHSWSIDGRTLWMGSRGEIDLATREIDLVIMISPFKTIDRIINAIPGIRSILGGRLVAIPMKAAGTLDDPHIVPLSPSAVGTSIVEMIERMFMLPIEVVQPLIPGFKEPESGTIGR